MSLVNLLLLSTTPIAGLGVLLGIDRFEKYVLEERPAHESGGAVVEEALQPDLAAASVQAEPAHQAAA